MVFQPTELKEADHTEGLFKQPCRGGEGDGGQGYSTADAPDMAPPKATAFPTSIRTSFPQRRAYTSSLRLHFYSSTRIQRYEIQEGKQKVTTKKPRPWFLSGVKNHTEFLAFIIIIGELPPECL